MLFVALLKVRAGTTRERAARRVQWQHSEGVQPIAEYWLQTTDPRTPNVVAVFEADSIGPIMATFAAWDDFFDITVLPAITAAEGLELVKQMMGE